jgi:hypothetical protein
MHLGFPLWAKGFSTLAKSSLQAALQAAHSQGGDTAGFKFYPVQGGVRIGKTPKKLASICCP